jgi:8-oxo-dGTP diphosphatase
MRPSSVHVTVDVAIFTIRDGALHVLLVKRRAPPFEGDWAMPGGHVETDEPLEAAALRELREETGVTDVYIEQLYTFGDPGRDPRGRYITVAYFALISADHALHAGTDAAEARWWPARKLPKLAFDHRELLTYAIERLRNKLEYTTVGFQLLAKRFTLSELQDVYEAILGRELDKRNFRRKIEMLGILTPLKEFRRTGAARPAQLYQFSARKFEKLRSRGITFPF